MIDPRHPVGKFEMVEEVSDREWIQQVAEAPVRLRAAVQGLTPGQMETPYRAGGWTVRQVVHHLPDSHFNAYARFKLALTEEEPPIKPYHEDRWAELADSMTVPPGVSLALLEALHSRWVGLLRSLTPADFARTFRHPESGIFTLDRALAMYAWHGRHHVAQITSLRERMGWS